METKVWDIPVEAQTVATMPWGKHKGKPLGEVPKDYLEWAVHKADAMNPDLRAAMERVLGLFPGSTGPPPSKPSEVKPDPEAPPEERRQITILKHGWERERKRVSELEREVADLRAELAAARKDRPSDMDVFRRVVKQWFAAMSRRFHPDMGGSVEKQVVLNLCYGDLIRRLEA